MRIAVVTTSYPAFEGDPCGHFVEAEAKALAATHEVVVVAPTHGERPERGSSTRKGGLRVVRLEGGGAFGWPGVVARVQERPLRAAFAAAWTRRASKALREIGPFDRVVSHWAVPCGWPIAMGGRHELVAVSHGGDVRALARLPAFARARLVRALARRASVWRFVSDALLHELRAVLTEGEAREVARVARVEPCRLEIPDVRAAIASRRAARGGRPLYACVGRLVPGKRFDRAIRHVASTAPAAELVVVGDGPERPRLEARAHSLGVDVCFVGRTSRDDALAWIGASDVVLQASCAEGLSTVVREAEALGVRVETLGGGGSFDPTYIPASSR